MKKIAINTTIILALVIAATLYLKITKEKPNQTNTQNNKPTLTYYTNQGATAPQLPFWAGIQNNELNFANIQTKYWKNGGELTSLILAGKGDIWLGHIEGFAKAKQHGAPIKLVAVTGWKKFYIISNNPKHTNLKSFYGETIPFAPVSSPAIPILKSILAKEKNKIQFQPCGAKQLAMQIIRGKYQCAILPEPMVTMILNKDKSQKIVASIAELYAKQNGGKARIPLAGFAINTNTAKKYPQLEKQLLKMLKKNALLLNQNPKNAISYLPKQFNKTIPKKIVQQSLARDLIHVESAKECKQEIIQFLQKTSPNLFNNKQECILDDSFFENR